MCSQERGYLVLGFCLFGVRKSGFVYSALGLPWHLVGPLAANFAEVMLGLVFIQLNFYPEYGALDCRVDAFNYNICSFQLN